MVMKSVTRLITERLKLKVNQAKNAVARPWERKFLGFSFTGEREPRRRIAPKGHRPIPGAGADSGTDASNPRHQLAQDGCRNRNLFVRLVGLWGYFVNVNSVGVETS
jgi:hypothetical protein